MHDKATLFAWGLIGAVIVCAAIVGTTIWRLVSGFIRATS